MANNLVAENLKYDTNGRVIVFDIENMTFCNVYLPSGNEPVKKNSRKNYVAETLPQILVDAQDNGCIGGDWNCVVEAKDATRNLNSKKSNGLLRLIKNFSWKDSFRIQHPTAKQFSRYYTIPKVGVGASLLDRMYHYGNLEILDVSYVDVAFSDHLSLIVKIKAPKSFAKLSSPKFRSFYKSKPEVIKDFKFQKSLKEYLIIWSQLKEETNLTNLQWWELIVKPNIKNYLFTGIGK